MVIMGAKSASCRFARAHPPTFSIPRLPGAALGDAQSIAFGRGRGAPLLDEGVSLTPGRAGELGGDGGCPAGRELLREQIDGAPEKGGIDARRGACRARHHDRDLASPEVLLALRPLGELRQGTAVDRLVRFGELARDYRAPLATELGGESGERRADAVGRFEKDLGARLVRER